jgi:hypothetical protein
MARSLSAFTRLTLLIGELKDRRIEDLADVTKCDLAHHTASLRTEFATMEHGDAASRIDDEGRSVLDLIREGETGKAEAVRDLLLQSCRQLKDQL